MTRFSKGQIQEVINIVLLANTPQSLLKALLKTPVVDDLRKNFSNEQLLDYYKKITARKKRHLSWGLWPMPV